MIYSDDASVFTAGNNLDRIGSIYKKAVYREYTDDTFTTEIQRDDDWLHLGILGPIIRGITGERIKIIFYNNCTQNYSMHPHGVFYKKPSEGAMYKQTGFGSNWNKPVQNGGEKVLPGIYT